MPIGTCDPATRGDAFNATSLERPAPDGSGSVLIDIHYGWDGVSVRPDCNGPVWYLRVRNNSALPAWALLPNKKQGQLWMQGDPGTDQIIGNATAASRTGGVTNQLTSLGLLNYQDVAGIGVTFTPPA